MAKLLLIEDEKILRENTYELLEAYGYDCITAKNGTEGLEKALTEKPDLIICDIMLPTLNGFEIKAALNEKEALAHTPFIFLSAKVGRSDLRQGMDLGAADYITKPFKIAELVNSIKSRLEHVKNIQTAVQDRVLESINDFIHLAKHECNTPLHSIINLSTILADNHTNQLAFFEHGLNAINTSGKRLYKILNNLIDLVRLRHYNAPIDDENNAIDLLSIIVPTLAERATYYNYIGEVKTNFDCQHTIKMLQEDLDIILFEVIDNMFKFSSENNVSLHLDTKFKDNGKWMVLTVSNTISAPTNFTVSDIGPFKQYNRKQNEQQGSGLGLYLIQLIVDKYLGTIKIEESCPLVFCITLSFPITE